MKDNLIAGAVLAGVAAAILGVVMLMGSLGCWWKWSDSGMRTRYRPFAGCQAERHGHWFPTTTIRETP